ncbi:MAG TPA: histidine kinase, partial [Pyrinomonadaceae bacterium]|nr:histidine kinase [Pyrinomonadaceae bacterium]
MARYSSNRFYTFDEKDGFLKYSIGTIFGNKNGEVFLSFGKTQIVRIKDEKIENVEIIDSKGRYWIGGFYDLQAQDGEFWLSTINGLFRFPKTPDFKDLARIKPKKIYTTADGFYSNEAVAIFEDSRGDIWISATTPENSLLRWEKSTEKIHRYTFDYGLPKGSGAISFGEDAAGNIWIGFYFGQIIRYKDGKFRDFTVEGLIQRNFVTKFLSDDKGRLWFSTSSRGLFRVENPNDETPVFTNFSTANGLSSNQTNCLTKDKLGRIYVTTGKGINRIEPDTERIKIFTQNDGLPSNLIQMCYADVNGNLWFSSVSSLIKYTPTAEKPSAPPPILIDQISINGKPQPVSELGEKEIKNLQFNSDERQIQIGFFAISFEAGETLRYQYKLNNQDWSAPSDQRSVSFDLAAGSYEFAVRAINSDGAVSEKTAVASFKILPPIWQRWWFLLLTFLFVAGAVFALDRYRVAKTRQVEAALEALRKSREERFAELQRVRTRIATDLHDDIGSSLTQIAVLTEVARGQASFLEAENLSTPLERIKNVSKELVAVMSDVGWAINPQKDFLQDLVQRMRRFASDVFTTRGIKFEFIVPEIEENLSLGANIRREVFAIFKESVNNAVKYSECTQARAEFR